MASASKLELYDLQSDVHEAHDIAKDHPEIVASLMTQYDAWWEDIQPYPINDHLENVPALCKPYHDLYRLDFGQDRFDEAMKKMTWTGGKPYGEPRANPRRKPAAPK